MSKVLFITKASGGTASARVRINNLVPELEKAGFSTMIVSSPNTLWGKWLLVRLCTQFDVVFLQKMLPSLFYAQLLRAVAKKLVFDFDDAIYYKPNNPGELRGRQRLRRFKNMVRKADLVIAGNSILAEEAQNYTRHCKVLPSAVETRNLAVKNYEVSTEKFVIGWVGNKANLTYLEELVPVFQKLAKQYEIQVRIISSRAVDIPDVETLFIPWDVNTQEAEIAQFDVGVMPLHDYPHARGKCAYKALQYMAAGVPPVVSDVGINSRVVEHGVCGFVVSELKDFDVFIEKLIVDRSLLVRMGSAAKIKVAEQFSIERVGKDLAGMLA
jgi:glycosyltransferase involved in cell wall biosynthesis